MRSVSASPLDLFEQPARGFFQQPASGEEKWSVGVLEYWVLNALLHHSSLHQAGVVCDGLNVLNDLNDWNWLLHK